MSSAVLLSYKMARGLCNPYGRPCFVGYVVLYVNIRFQSNPAQYLDNSQITFLLFASSSSSTATTNPQTNTAHCSQTWVTVLTYFYAKREILTLKRIVKYLSIYLQHPIILSPSTHWVPPLKDGTWALAKTLGPSSVAFVRLRAPTERKEVRISFSAARTVTYTFQTTAH